MANSDRSNQTPEQKGITWKQIKVIFLLLLITLVVVVVAKNTAPAPFWFFKWHPIPLINLLVGSVLLGMGIVLIIVSMRAGHRKREIKKLRKEVKGLQDEVKRSSRPNS